VGTTDLVAWWGAILATLVFIWDLYKWLASGPKIKLQVDTNMQLINVPGWNADRYVTVRAINVGDQPTTITTLGLFHYRSLYDRLRNDPTTKAVVAVGGITQPLPYTLNPTCIWDGAIEQNSDVERMLRNGYFFVLLYHSGAKRPVQRRARLRRGNNT
jgi:hypothetical protein